MTVSQHKALAGINPAKYAIKASKPDMAIINGTENGEILYGTADGDTISGFGGNDKQFLDHVLGEHDERSVRSHFCRPLPPRKPTRAGR